MRVERGLTGIPRHGVMGLQICSLLARCHLYLGIGYNLQAAENHLKQQK
jgi:hypothetical protein